MDPYNPQTFLTNSINQEIPNQQQKSYSSINNC